MEKVMVKLYKEKAAEQFRKLVLEKIEWISKDCWPSNLEFQLKKLNNIIEAGKKMEVTTASTFSELEIQELADQIGPFRVLEMNGEIQSILIGILTDVKEVSHEVFAK